MDVKLTADPQREKEILATVDPFIKEWLGLLKDALSGAKITISINITGLYPPKPATLPDEPTPKENISG